MPSIDDARVPWVRDARDRDVRESTRAGREEVARVAYELYERAGRRDGRDLEDWFKAEALVQYQSQRQTQQKE